MISTALWIPRSKVVGNGCCASFWSSPIIAYSFVYICLHAFGSYLSFGLFQRTVLPFHAVTLNFQCYRRFKVMCFIFLTTLFWAALWNHMICSFSSIHIPRWHICGSREYQLFRFLVVVDIRDVAMFKVPQILWFPSGSALTIFHFVWTLSSASHTVPFSRVNIYEHVSLVAYSSSVSWHFSFETKRTSHKASSVYFGVCCALLFSLCTTTYAFFASAVKGIPHKIPRVSIELLGQ